MELPEIQEYIPTCEGCGVQIPWAEHSCSINFCMGESVCEEPGVIGWELANEYCMGVCPACAQIALDAINNAFSLQKGIPKERR